MLLHGYTRLREFVFVMTGDHLHTLAGHVVAETRLDAALMPSGALPAAEVLGLAVRAGR